MGFKSCFGTNVKVFVIHFEAVASVIVVVGLVGGGMRERGVGRGWVIVSQSAYYS